MVHILSGNSLYISIVSYLFIYLSCYLMYYLLYHVYVMYDVCSVYVMCVMPREIVLSIVCLSNALSNVCLSIVCVSLGAPYVVGRSPDLMVVRTGQKKTPNRYRPGFLLSFDSRKMCGKLDSFCYVIHSNIFVLSLPYPLWN